MGTVTAATLANSYLAYAGIGFKINQTMSAMGPDSGVASLTPTGSGVTISYTGTVGSGVVLRAEISDGTMRWCRNVAASPSTIAYSSFNTACWDTAGGVAYNKQPINEFQLIVVGGSLAAGYNVSLTGIVENP
jgi:hypothetical protein